MVLANLLKMSVDLLQSSQKTQTNSTFPEGPHVTKLETEAATIKFFAPTSGDTSSSESEDEEIRGPYKDATTVISSSSVPCDIVNDKEYDVSVSSNDTVAVVENGISKNNDGEVMSDSYETHHANDHIENSRQENVRVISKITNCEDENHSTKAKEVEDVKEPQVNSGIEADDTAESRVRVDEKYAEQLADMRSKRFNPFDHDVHVTEDHFAEEEQSHLTDHAQPNPEDFPKSQRVCRQSFSSTTSDTWSDIHPFSTTGGDLISNAELGLAEDHFSQPEGYFGLSTIEELEMAIANCKRLIAECPDKTDRKRNLVYKLIQLRMKLLDAKEGPVEEDPSIKSVLGHKLMHRDSSKSKHYCEKCNAVIWGVLQSWYKCKECGYCCHAKCLHSVTRTCASVKVAENASYILSVCPEKGLAAQKYRCAECKTPISNNDGTTEPRLCDYNGCYYCEICHWNDVSIIPARILHNWDFEPRKVCRASKQFLKLMYKISVVRIQDINPMLFSFVEELNEVKKLREEILIMKKYFLSCQAALSSKLLLQLTDRQHFVENSDMYSVRDLLDTRTDELLPLLARIHSSFAQHIKTDCKLCQAKGFMCELCDVQEVLFPFDNIAIVCAQCSTVLHRHCFVKRQNRCPKCERRMQREASRSSNSSQA